MKMLRFLTAALGIMAATAAEAQTAPWAMQQSAQPQSWQGFYLGINAGGVWGHDDVHGGAAATGFNPDFDTRGGEEGFQGGYNAQFGNIVAGIDANFDWSGSDGGYRIIGNLDGQDQKFEWLSGIRARVGIPLENWMPYVTGGIAFSDIKDSYVTGTGLSDDNSKTRSGWTVGGGLEYMMPENFTARLDYRYTDFGSYTDGSNLVFPGSHFKQEPTINEATLGISYYFK